MLDLNATMSCEFDIQTLFVVSVNIQIPRDCWLVIDFYLFDQAHDTVWYDKVYNVQNITLFCGI